MDESCISNSKLEILEWTAQTPQASESILRFRVSNLRCRIRPIYDFSLPALLSQRGSTRFADFSDALHNERLTPQALRMAFSSSALIAFLKRAPDFPFTLCSQPVQVAWRIATPSITLR